MTIQAQATGECDAFLSARQQFDQIVARLASGEPETLAKTEEYLHVEGLELQRQLLQARLDVLFERERVELAAHPPAKDVETRSRARQIESRFGRVVEHRHGRRQAGKPSQFALDEKLNVPADLYSHPLRRRVAEEVADGSFDHAVAQIERTTGGHVPKRQAQQLAVRAAQDVEGFYVEQPQPANDTLSASALLLLSSDGCAIRMVRKGLREPTRRAAQKAEEQAETTVRGDPTAAVPVKPHQTRRAVVTAVWEQERHTRTAADVVANLHRRPNDPEHRQQARAPRPQNKRLTASVEQDQRLRISEMFDEADRRDPEQRRETVVLVDGDEHQTEAIQQEAQRRQRPLTLVLDLLHAMHYLWVAAKAITQQRGKSIPAQTEKLVSHWATMLLTGDPSRLVATIRGTATRLRLRGKARQAVDSAADYLLKRTAFINYSSFIARGLPIASGVIEGACRYLVRDRLDITGARWNVEDAEAVLSLRAVRASGDWDDYWEFHQRQEAHRNFPAAA
jgi:hypothetical protein